MFSAGLALFLLFLSVTGLILWWPRKLNVFRWSSFGTKFHFDQYGGLVQAWDAHGNWIFYYIYRDANGKAGQILLSPNYSERNRYLVFNYSWPLFPYVWNEVKFNIAYESDLQFVSATMQKIAEEELGEMMMEKVKIFRDLLARTPVNHLEVHERPSVLFRVSDNTWLEAIVRYLVHPKDAGRAKSQLTQKLLAALNAAPDRVLFPKSNAR